MTTMDYIKRHPEFDGMTDEQVLSLMLHVAMSTSDSVRQVLGRKNRINKGDDETGYVLIVDRSDPRRFANFFRREPNKVFPYLRRQRPGSA